MMMNFCLRNYHEWDNESYWQEQHAILSYRVYVVFCRIDDFAQPAALEEMQIPAKIPHNPDEFFLKMIFRHYYDLSALLSFSINMFPT